MLQSITLSRYLSAKAFEAMPNLRFFHAIGISFQGRFGYFPNKMKWLELESCNFDDLPSQCQLEKVVVLDLCQSNLARAFTKLCLLEEKVFVAMKFLRICSEDLTSTPNFSATPFVVNLMFDECRMLSGVHQSIGNLKNLTCLDLRSCCMLEKLPDTICQLSSLKMLNLSDCRKLSSLPEQLGCLASLRELTLDGTSIGIIPDSIGRLENLYFLSVEDCLLLKKLPQSVQGLNSLQKLGIKGTSLEGVPRNIDDLMNIGTVNASCCNWLCLLPNSSYKTVRSLHFSDLRCPTIAELPDSIGKLENLERLSLECKNLRCIPASVGLLERLSSFSLCGSQWIKDFPAPMGNLKNLVQLEISGTGMVEMPYCIGDLTNLRSLNLSHNSKLLISLSGLTALSSLEVLIAHSSSWADDDDSDHGDFGNLSSLKIIDLRESHFSVLPSSITRIPVLQELNLGSCMELQSLPGLSASLVCLDAFKCANIKMIADVSNLESMNELHLDGCSLLVDVCGLERLPSLEILTLRDCHSLGDAFKQRVFKEATFPQLRKFEASGTMIPHFSVGSQISFMFPRAPTGDQLVIEFLFLQGVSKPVQPFLRKPIAEPVTEHVHITVITDGSVVFQTRRLMECSFVVFEKEDEIFGHLREGQHVIQVSADSAEAEGLTVGDIWVRYEKGGDKGS
ncbi:Disease resistance protein [Nymphaea thermarum]|nr:Disease resistance protein [Nymphaea thermarum]